MLNNIQIEYNLKFKKYIQEGLKKYNQIFYDPYAPPKKYAFPEIFVNSRIKKRCVPFFKGRLKIYEGSGEYRAILKLCKKIAESGGKIKILDVGCANCDLADYLENGHNISIDYYGVDISAHCNKYTVAEKIEQINTNEFDLVVMTHVAEHLSLDDYIENYQEKIVEKLKAGGYFVFAVPNPLNPKNYFCDLTHIQKFPWHQTYALLRFSFTTVSVKRIENLNRFFDIIFLPVRILACRLTYHDTAGTLIFLCNK